jgi:hypothetical protein
MKNYYSNEGYFNKIIDNYFKQNDGWIKVLDRNKKCDNKKCDNIEFHHVERQLCSTCNVSCGFIDTSSLGNKKKLYDNMIEWSKNTSNDISYLPKSYSFTNNNYKKLQKIFTTKYWIIKPEHGMRQHGITIINSYPEFVKGIKKYPEYKLWIIQEYINKPLLYNNKKFHFRIYVVLLKTDDVFETYLYPKGYMYVADDIYNANDVNNIDKHITSSCNNKEFPFEYDKYYGKNDFQNKLKPQIKKIVHDTTDATYKYMMCANVGKGKLCYKMIAYDIIADSNKKLHLLEINARVIGMASTDLPGNCKSKNPSLQTVEFKTELMTNILNVALKQNNKDIIFEKVLHRDLNLKWMYPYVGMVLLFIILYYIYNNKFLK